MADTAIELLREIVKETKNKHHCPYCGEGAWMVKVGNRKAVPTFYHREYCPIKRAEKLIEDEAGG